MDFWRALQELHNERERLEKVIHNLEALARGQQPTSFSSRGRKSMPDEERKQVSERMRKYWASRRKSGAREGSRS
jgi:flagellar motor component MotA